MTKKIKVYQLAVGPIPAEIQKAIDKNKLFCFQNDIDYELVEIPAPEGVSYRDLTAISDEWRAKKASVDPDFLFVCWDLEIVQMPDFSEDGAPYFIDQNGDSYQPDTGFMYCNGQTEFFKEVLKKMNDKYKGVYCGIKKAIRGCSHITISEDCFNHPEKEVIEE